MKSIVNGIGFTLNERILSDLLQVPFDGYAEYEVSRPKDGELTTRFTQGGSLLVLDVC